MYRYIVSNIDINMMSFIELKKNIIKTLTSLYSQKVLAVLCCSNHGTKEEQDSQKE